MSALLLGPMQARIWRALCAAPGHALSKPALIQAAYPDGNEPAHAEASLRHQVGHLRRRMAPRGIVITTTEDGYGYERTGMHHG